MTNRQRMTKQLQIYLKWYRQQRT